MLVFKCKVVNDQNYSVIKIEQAAPPPPKKKVIHFLLIPIQTIQIKKKFCAGHKCLDKHPRKKQKKEN